MVSIGDENAWMRSRLPLNGKEERRKVAESLAPGSKRDAVLRKARQDEAAVHMTEWLNSSGLKPPT
jgi:hypothetical protein